MAATGRGQASISLRCMGRNLFFFFFSMAKSEVRLFSFESHRSLAETLILSCGIFLSLSVSWFVFLFGQAHYCTPPTDSRSSEKYGVVIPILGAKVPLLGREYARTHVVIPSYPCSIPFFPYGIYIYLSWRDWVFFFFGNLRLFGYSFHFLFPRAGSR